jgi:cytochrome c peroxidase
VGEKTLRNAPGLANAAWNATYTWANPALTTVEKQMAVPLFGDNPIEMGVNDRNRAEILARLAKDPEYPAMFRAAFPDRPKPITLDGVVKSVAVFVRGIVSVDSRYDRSLQGRERLTESEERGRELFFGEKAECHHCHNRLNFNDQVVHAKTRVVETPFHNTGLYNLDAQGAYPAGNRGVYELSGRPQDMGAFRAPSLRNVALTAPYMHDGSVATLEEVVDIYGQGGRNISSGPYKGDGRLNPHKDALISPIAFTPQEKADLVAFLKTLTDDHLVRNPRLSDPFAHAQDMKQK